MPADPNVLVPDWDEPPPGRPPGARFARVAHHAGARELGATLYELDRGGLMAPYHLHHANEELLVVLAGRPRLRTPEGERELEPGSVVAFPTGPAGAHTLHNDHDEPARFLIASTMRYPEIAEYPDTGAVLPMTGPGEGRAYRGGTDVPYPEVVVEAIRQER